LQFTLVRLQDTDMTQYAHTNMANAEKLGQKYVAAMAIIKLCVLVNVMQLQHGFLRL